MARARDLEKLPQDASRQPLLAGEERRTSYVKEGTLGEHIEVKPMRYWDIPSVAESIVQGFANNPLFDYIENTPEHKSRRGTRFYFQWWGSLASKIHAGLAYTVNSGEAMMFIRTPGHKSSLTERAMEAFSAFATTFGVSAEQKRRLTELHAAESGAITEAFGDRLEHMLQMAGLVTRPDKQGGGYGTALMAVANAKADELGAATYISTTAHNTAFYEGCGYVVATRFTVGENNPKWDQPPVVLCIMFREAPNATV